MRRHALAIAVALVALSLSLAIADLNPVCSCFANQDSFTNTDGTCTCVCLRDHIPAADPVDGCVPSPCVKLPCGGTENECVPVSATSWTCNCAPNYKPSADGLSCLPLSIAVCEADKLCGPRGSCEPLDPTTTGGRIDKKTAPFKCGVDPCTLVSCADGKCCESYKNKLGQYIGFSCVNKCELVKCASWAPYCINVKDAITGKCGAQCVNPCAGAKCPDGENCEPIFDAFGFVDPKKYICVDPCTKACKTGLQSCCKKEPVKVDNGQGLVTVVWNVTSCADPCWNPNPAAACGGRPYNCESFINADVCVAKCVDPCADPDACPAKDDCCKSVPSPKKDFLFVPSCENPCKPSPCRPYETCVPLTALNKCDHKCVHPCEDNPCGPGENCLPAYNAAGDFVPGKYQCVNPCKDPKKPEPCKGDCCKPKPTGLTFPNAQYAAGCKNPCKVWPCPKGQNCVPVVDNAKDICRRKCTDPCLSVSCADKDECCSPVLVPGTWPPWLPVWNPSCNNPCDKVMCKWPYRCKVIKDKYGRCMGTQCVSPCEPNPCGKYENCEYVTNALGVIVADPATGDAMFQCVNPCTKKPCPWWPKRTCCKPVWDPLIKKWRRSCTNPCTSSTCKFPTPFCKPVVDPVTHMCKGTQCYGWPCATSPCGVDMPCLDLSNPTFLRAELMGEDLEGVDVIAAGITATDAIIDATAVVTARLDAGTDVIIPPPPSDPCSDIKADYFTCPVCEAGYISIDEPGIPVPKLPIIVQADKVASDSDLLRDVAAASAAVGAAGSVDGVPLDVMLVDDDVGRDAGSDYVGTVTIVKLLDTDLGRQCVLREAGSGMATGRRSSKRCVPGVDICKRDSLCGKQSKDACAPAPPLSELVDAAELKAMIDSGVTGLIDVLELNVGYICNKNPCENIRCAPPNCCVPKSNKWGLYTGFSCVNPCSNTLCKKPLYCRPEMDKIGQCVGSCCVNPCQGKPCPKPSVCKPRFDDWGVITNDYDCVSPLPPNPCTDPNTAIMCANNGCCKPAWVNSQLVATCDYPCVGPFATCWDNSAVCKPNQDKFGVCTGGWHCEVIPL